MNLRDPRAAALLFAVGISSAPLAASAQNPSYATSRETIRGTVASVRDLNHLLLTDDRGFTDDVTLQNGASVVPNGVRLEPGQRVTVEGSNAGSTFLANRIATTASVRRSDDDSFAAIAPAYYPGPFYGYPRYGRFYAPISVGLFFHFR